MTAFVSRLAKIERKVRNRPRRHLPSQERKHLTDAAVAGDAEALKRLASFRLDLETIATPEQRSAAIAAGMRADT